MYNYYFIKMRFFVTHLSHINTQNDLKLKGHSKNIQTIWHSHKIWKVSSATFKVLGSLGFAEDDRVVLSAIGSLSNGGRDRVDDVPEHLLKACEVVCDSSELSIHDWTLHSVTCAWLKSYYLNFQPQNSVFTCHSAVLRSPSYCLHFYCLTELLGHHEADSSAET